MTPPTIGWYVHHHGHGHLARFLAIRAHLDADVVAFSTLPAPADLPGRTTWVRLDRDDEAEQGTSGRILDPSESDPTANGVLHWAPLGHHGHRSRLARIAVETLRRHLDAFVVDVSVEVTMFVRLLGIPVVVVAQPGARSDDPHRLAYRVATRILAPWPAGHVSLPIFDPAADVVFTGGISRYDGRPPVPVGRRRGVVALLGSGGDDVSPGGLDDLAAASPGDVTILGAGRTWTDEPWPLLAGAAVVVSWAGQNSVADLAAADARAIVIPQQRPFDEQVETGRALERAGLALVETAWPSRERWSSLIAAAGAQDPSWSAWQTNGAAGRAAAAILDTASTSR